MSSLYFFRLYAIDRVIDLFPYLFCRSPGANLVHSLPHGNLDASPRFILLDKRLEVLVLSDILRLLIMLPDGATHFIAPFSLKTLSNAAVHIFS